MNGGVRILTPIVSEEIWYSLPSIKYSYLLWIHFNPSLHMSVCMYIYVSVKVVRLLGTLKFSNITLATIIFCLRMSIMSINDNVMVVVQINLRFYTLFLWL
jgi:hypothetical protein